MVGSKLSCARHWLAALALALGMAAAQASELVLAVNEGVTYRVPQEQIVAKYTAIAADLGKLLKRNVVVQPVGDYPTLRAGLAAKRYDLALVHPAHLSIVALRDSGYTLVAVTQGFQTYSANFLVRADAPYKGLAELKGLRLGAPDEDSITSWMVRATLRDALGGADQVRYVYTRYQDAVPFFVENHLTPAGATASSAVIKAWTEKGGKVLFKSKPVPIKHVIAGPALSADEVRTVRAYLLALADTDDGRKKLEPTKLKGFAAYEQSEMMTLGKWLGL
ncbi:MAG TPA: PhnD/SsuA/transferrin family substrate-binding protein [Methylibium sp.]|nr:PhnD/SsuA/transferrin family substrate-binding protein [Methylibium sp.]